MKKTKTLSCVSLTEVVEMQDHLFLNKRINRIAAAIISAGVTIFFYFSAKDSPVSFYVVGLPAYLSGALTFFYGVAALRVTDEKIAFTQALKKLEVHEVELSDDDAKN